MALLRLSKGRRSGGWRGARRPSASSSSSAPASAAQAAASVRAAASAASAASAAWAASAASRATRPVLLESSARVLCADYGVSEESLRGIQPSALSGRLGVVDILAVLYQRSLALCAAHMSTAAGEGTQQRRWSFGECPDLVCKGAAPRNAAALRTYQVASLERLLDPEGRALSGNAKLPCGAGKTLLALWHAVRLETYTLVLTNSNMSTLQWVAQLRANFSLPEGAVLALGTGVSSAHNARNRLLRTRPMFVVCTYSTATLQGAPDSAVALLRVLPYGLLILDETQTAVAKFFRRALEIPCASVLAISATFMRQDGCIELLQQQVGPLLVDVPRALLVAGNFIADVSRVELHVSGPGPGGDAALHPHKVAALLSLLEHHLLREGDKVVVFCDWLQHVAAVHRLLLDHVRGRAAVLGPVTMHTPAGQRQAHLEAFRRADRAVLCLSRVADSAVDLPGANVLVQVSCSAVAQMTRTGRMRPEARRSARASCPAWPHQERTRTGRARGRAHRPCELLAWHVQRVGRGSPLTARP